MSTVKYIIFATGLIFAAVLNAAVTKIATGGHTAYQLEVGRGEANEPLVFSAAYDGMVLCHSQTGEFKWKTDIGEGFPFDIEVADIDGDGRDEVLTASSDGNLYVLDDDGSILWTFTSPAPLYQVKVAVQSGQVYVLTGGVDKNLYLLNAQGQELRRRNLGQVIRLIATGDFKGNGETYVGVAAARIALSGKFNLHFYRLDEMMERIWFREMTYQGVSFSGRFFNVIVFDQDKDGKEEMVFSHDHTDPNTRTVFKEDGTHYYIKETKWFRKGVYKMNLDTYIPAGTTIGETIIDLYGHRLLFFNTDGTFRNDSYGKYAFNASAYDNETKNYILGSELSGGDGIYIFNLQDPGWRSSFENLQPVGKMVKIEQNLAMLKTQLLAYNPTKYQQPVNPVPLCLDESAQEINQNYTSTGLFDKVEFGQYLVWSENYDRSFLREGWSTKKDNRKPYNLTQGQIVQMAQNLEAKGENFFVWAGHGTDPFYMQLGTMEKILQAAPNTFKAFIFAELESTNNAMIYAINSHLKPLADLCKQYGDKKILLRNKNVFWNSTAYLPMWQNVFADKKYKEVFVPSMEETNSRTQALSLSGRTGLWKTGFFENLSGRAVTDNLNYNRLWEWCHVQNLSAQIRSMSQRRIQGANVFLLNIYTKNQTQMIPFYLMLEKGILPEVTSENLISVPDVAIGMTSPPDHDYEEHGSNGHEINQFSNNEPEMVFDKLDCYWGGAPVPDHDFTRYAFNSTRRLTNFIAQSPYGNITMIPATTDTADFPWLNKILKTDGKFWYDETGAQRTATEYKSTVISQLEESAAKMKIRVTGEVGWSAIQIAPSVIRVVLIDPGYVDPDDREAVIAVKDMEGAVAKDILSGDDLPIIDGKINVTVPMGILKVVDIILYPFADAGKDITIDTFPVDSVIIYGKGIDDVGITSFKWTQTGGADVTMVNVDSSTLILKDLPEGEFFFRLTVSDELGNSGSDEVKVTVFCEECHTPEILLSTDRLVRLPKDTLHLNGYASVDLGFIEQYTWTKLSGPDIQMQGINSPMLILSELNDGEYNFRLSVMSDAGISASSEVYVTVFSAPDTIPKIVTSIVIDGVMETDWCSPEMPVDKRIKGYLSTPSYASFLWDENYLYCFVKVSDKFLNNDSGNEWWNDDAVEIFIDADNSKGMVYGEKDFHFGFRWHWNIQNMDIFEKIHENTEGVNWAIKEISNGFNLEAAIPWELLKTTPQRGNSLGVELRIINDDDGLAGDHINAIFGYSDKENPEPFFFGTMSMGSACMVSNSNPKITKSLVKVYPSVTNNGIVNIILNDIQSASCIVYDITGKQVLEKKIFEKDTVDVSKLKSGIYVFKIYYDNLAEMFKIISL